MRSTRVVFALVVIWCAIRLSPAPTAQQPIPLVEAVHAVQMTVTDLDRAIDFYSRVLSFEKVSTTTVHDGGFARLEGVPETTIRIGRLRLGDEIIDLVEYGSKGRAATATPSNDRSFQHVAIVVRDMDWAYQAIRPYVQAISSGPQRLPDWNAAAAGISAFYFRDPDGHPLELIHFPAGKGPSKWHRPTDRTFEGIDHTAITVGDAARSLAFYRDLLGFRVAGGSENWLFTDSSAALRAGGSARDLPTIEWAARWPTSV